MGNIFFRGGNPAEIEATGYRSLKYWSDWHDVFTQAEKAAMPERKGNA